MALMSGTRARDGPQKDSSATCNISPLSVVRYVTMQNTLQVQFVFEHWLCSLIINISIIYFFIFSHLNIPLPLF